MKEATAVSSEKVVRVKGLRPSKLQDPLLSVQLTTAATVIYV
jgi:hypothetical protein